MKTSLSFKSIIIGAISLFFTPIIYSQNVDSINVVNYNISLDVNNIRKNGHIGYCNIKARVINPNFKWAKLSLLNHSVDSIWVDNQPMNFIYNSPNLIFELPFGVLNNDTVDIRVKYTGAQVVEAYGWGGIHYDNNIIYTLNVAIMDTPHSFGRSWFPCQEKFNDKASFNYNITTNSSRQVYCGGILDSISLISDSSSTYHYTLPQPIPPYLASMTIANYVLVGDTVNGINGTYPVEVWCFPNDSTTIRSKIDMIKKAFHGMESNFGPFAFNKIRYCVTPNGSMEHVDNIALAHSAAVGAGNGNNSNIIHELAHFWFGCYMGGETEENMWIKEGWTSMTETLSMWAAFGEKHAKDFFRDEQEWVLNILPKNEGYRALYPVSGQNVYARTTYRKGAAVVHTLKGYLGDSLFYAASKDMLSQYGYHYINTYQMRDYLSQRTGIDLNDFWNFHILDSGYNHYQLTKKKFNSKQAIIGIKQMMVANNIGLLSNRVPITFFDSLWNPYKKIISFSGYNTIDTIELGFTPINCFLDLDEEIADATLDNYAILKETGEYIFPNTFSFIDIKSIQDSVFIRTTLNWVGEERNAALPNGVKRISHKHFWTIEGIGLEKCEIYSNFFFKAASGAYNFDDELVRTFSGLDSLILMYRPNAQSPWIALNTTKTYNTEGYVNLNSLWEGDYIMAIGDISIVSLQDISNNNKEIELNIYPNPAQKEINLSLNENKKGFDIYIYGLRGEIVYKSNLTKDELNKKIDLNLENGVYPIVLISKDNKIRFDNKIIISK